MTTNTSYQPVARTIEVIDDDVAFYAEQGYLPLPAFLDPGVVDALREEVFDVLAANGLSRDDLARASSTADKLRQCSQYLAGSKLDALINGPASLALAGRLIGGRAVRYLPFTAVKAGGGGGTMHFHQDNSYTRHEPALGSINIWVALVDMTPANGCLQIVPGSHGGQREARTSDDRDSHRQVDVSPSDGVPMRMRAGDAIAFTRWTVHGSGPNTTSEPRVAYALQYHRDDVRWLDNDTGEWQLLVETPRSATPPVERLG